MEVEGAEAEPRGVGGSVGVSAVVTFLQLAAAVASLLVGWLVAANASGSSDDPWAGIEYVVYGVLAAPVVATVASPIAARLVKLRPAALYLLPVPVTVGVFVLLWRAAGYENLYLPVPFLWAVNLLLAAIVRRRPDAVAGAA